MIQDLTKITTPFGLLDEETQKALQKAWLKGKVVQIYGCGGWSDVDATPTLSFGYSQTYRLKPEPVRITTWTSVYPWGFGQPSCKREEVDEHQNPNRICVLRTEWCDGVPSFHKEEN